MSTLTLDYGVAPRGFNGTPCRHTTSTRVGDSDPIPAPPAPPPDWRCCLAIGCTQHIETHHIFCQTHWQKLQGFMRDELCRQHHRLHRWHCPDARQKYREAVMAAIDLLWAAEENELIQDLNDSQP
jgi:hypothetical protein